MTTTARRSPPASRWLDNHPEVVEELVAERFGLVWRKVGRREPRKAARATRRGDDLGVARAAGCPGSTGVLPPVSVDHECRPYELGWLLYAWLAARGDAEVERDRRMS